MQVIWKLLYKESVGDHGTLRYFCSLLNRSTVTSDLKKAVDANFEFVAVVVQGHLLASTCKAIGIGKLSGKISNLPRKVSATRQSAYIHQIAGKVVNECTLIDISGKVTETEDCVHNYARVLCHYGAILMVFKDACSEGDGERVFQCWRLLLPHFKATGRHKYALEALRIQFQVNALLSPQLAHHIKWDRFVNTRGQMGTNIPMDLYNEHVVKMVKKIIRCMGPNLTEKALQRAARSVSAINNICKQYDRESCVPVTSSRHSTLSTARDIGLVVDDVMSNKLLEVIPNRSHAKFGDMKLNPLWNFNKEKALEWIAKKKREFAMFKGAVCELEDNSEEQFETDSDSEDEAVEINEAIDNGCEDENVSYLFIDNFFSFEN